MTEAEWLDCTDPTPMLEFLSGKASDRKLRLFTVACARLVWEKISWLFLRKAVETAERHADGWASSEELDASCREVIGVFMSGQQGRHEAHAWVRSSAESLQVYGACLSTTFRPTSLNGLSRSASWRLGACLTGLFQPNLLRDIFGSLPFRPAPLDPAWLTWKNGTIPRLAQTIYEDRELPAGYLDQDRLAVLADALEDAGCSDPDLLGHCRGPGPHVRGCWVVDLLLGKE
jgi:hypothetical protein